MKKARLFLAILVAVVSFPLLTKSDLMADATQNRMVNQLKGQILEMKLVLDQYSREKTQQIENGYRLADLEFLELSRVMISDESVLRLQERYEQKQHDLRLASRFHGQTEMAMKQLIYCSEQLLNIEINTWGRIYLGPACLPDQ
jgi:hypothetical protein